MDEVHWGADFEVDFDADFEVDLHGDSRLILDGGSGWIWTLISRLIRSRGFGFGWFGADF